MKEYAHPSFPLFWAFVLFHLLLQPGFLLYPLLPEEIPCSVSLPWVESIKQPPCSRGQSAWEGTEKEQMIRTQRIRDSPPAHCASVTRYGHGGRGLRVSVKRVLLGSEKKKRFETYRDYPVEHTNESTFLGKTEKEICTLWLKRNSSKPWNKSSSDGGEKGNPKLCHGNVPIPQDTDAVRGLRMEFVLWSGWTCFSSSQRSRRIGRNEDAQLGEEREGRAPLPEGTMEIPGNW